MILVLIIAIVYSSHVVVFNDGSSKQKKDLSVCSFDVVVSLTLGIETIGGIMTDVIPRNSRIPIRKTKMFTTYQDNQSELLVQVYEGERSLTRHNNLLGMFELFGLQKAPRGVPQIEVSFEIDPNGMLTVSAKDLNTFSEETIFVKSDRLIHTFEEVKRLIKEYKSFEE